MKISHILYKIHKIKKENGIGYMLKKNANFSHLYSIDVAR